MNGGLLCISGGHKKSRFVQAAIILNNADFKDIGLLPLPAF